LGFIALCLAGFVFLDLLLDRLGLVHADEDAFLPLDFYFGVFGRKIRFFADELAGVLIVVRRSAGLECQSDTKGGIPLHRSAFSAAVFAATDARVVDQDNDAAELAGNAIGDFADKQAGVAFIVLVPQKTSARPSMTTNLAPNSFSSLSN
jgi:hypothetical protein